MESVMAHASRGIRDRICNGFQVCARRISFRVRSCETPDFKFVCRFVTLRVDQAATPFTSSYKAASAAIPIAQWRGRYVCDEATLSQLRLRVRSSSDMQIRKRC